MTWVELPVTPTQGAAIDACWNRIGVRGDGSCEQLPQHVHCRNCPVYSAAAATLLDAELSADYRAQWTSHVAREKSIDAADMHSIMVFRLRAEWLALPTSVLEEVAATRPVHSLPHRRGGVVLGLVNVRGELRACLSLARLLGLQDAAAATVGKAQTPERLLVLRRDEHCVALPVDEVHGVRRHQAGELQERPAMISRASASYTKAVLPWEQVSIGLLDEQLLFYAIDRSLASASVT